MAGFSSYLALAPLALVATVLAGPAALAARPGSGREAGPVSTASVRISLTVAPRLGAERAGLADGADSGASSARPLCIWSNAPIGTFSVTVSQAGGADSAAAAARPAYELEWRDGAGGSRVVPARPGTALSDLAAESRGACRGQGPASALMMRPAPGAEPASGADAPVLLLLISPD